MIKHYCDFCGCEIGFNSTFIFELKSNDFFNLERHEICTKCYLKAKSIFTELKAENK